MRRRVATLALFSIVAALCGRAGWNLTHPEIRFTPIGFECLKKPGTGTLSVRTNSRRSISVHLDWGPTGSRVGLSSTTSIGINWTEKPEQEVRALAASLLLPLTSGVPRSENEDVTSSVWMQCDGPAQTWEGRTPQSPNYLSCRGEKLSAIPECLRTQRALRTAPDPRAAAINDRVDRLFANAGYF